MSTCQAIIVPGPRGLAGRDGTDGWAGENAFTQLKGRWQVPAYLGTVTLEVDSTAWMAHGQLLLIGDTYTEVGVPPTPPASGSDPIYWIGQVVAKPTETTVTLKNLADGADAYPTNAAPGTWFPDNTYVVAAGAQGPRGTPVVWGDLDFTGSDTGDLAVFDVGDATTGVLAHERGGLEADVSAWNGLIKVASGATTQIKCNFGSATDPLVTDDSSGGYGVGSLWFNTTADHAWMCLDASVGAAVWKKLSLQESEIDGDWVDIDWNPTYYTPSAAPAEADDVDDLTAHLYGIDAELGAVGKQPGLLMLKTGLDLNAGVGDQDVVGMPSSYIVTKVVLTSSTNLGASPFRFGIYTGATGTGTAVVTDPHVLTAITGSATYQGATLATATNTTIYSAGTLKFYTTVVHGSAATANLRIYGYDLT